MRAAAGEETQAAPHLAALYEKDTRAAYASLRALEEMAGQSDVLYPHLAEFIAMLGSRQYVVRVRGFRLLCLQAKWDTAGVIDEKIDIILAALGDEKPTAVRQMLQYLVQLAPHKQALWPYIRAAVQGMELSRFKDTMLPLIEKDMAALLRVMA